MSEYRRCEKFENSKIFRMLKEPILPQSQVCKDSEVFLAVLVGVTSLDFTGTLLWARDCAMPHLKNVV